MESQTDEILSNKFTFWPSSNLKKKKISSAFPGKVSVIAQGYILQRTLADCMWFLLTNQIEVLVWIHVNQSAVTNCKDWQP